MQMYTWRHRWGLDTIGLTPPMNELECKVSILLFVLYLLCSLNLEWKNMRIRYKDHCKKVLQLPALIKMLDVVFFWWTLWWCQPACSSSHGEWKYVKLLSMMNSRQTSLRRLLGPCVCIGLLFGGAKAQLGMVELPLPLCDEAPSITPIPTVHSIGTAGILCVALHPKNRWVSEEWMTVLSKTCFSSQQYCPVWEHGQMCLYPQYGTRASRYCPETLWPQKVSESYWILVVRVLFCEGSSLWDYQKKVLLLYILSFAMPFLPPGKNFLFV